MAKYAPLAAHLSKVDREAVTMRFAEIEQIIGSPLPPVARSARAWWSNNGNNNVMTKAWLTAGYRSEQVDMAGERLVFRRTIKAAVRPSAQTGDGDVQVPRVLGILAGTVTFIGDVTEPTGTVWDAAAPAR